LDGYYVRDVAMSIWVMKGFTGGGRMERDGTGDVMNGTMAFIFFLLDSVIKTSCIYFHRPIGTTWEDNIANGLKSLGTIWRFISHWHKIDVNTVATAQDKQPRIA
jgi:hypothetical protein